MITVPSELSELSFTGNGVATAFPLTFPILETSDLVVTLTPTGGSETLQIEGVDYTVSAAPSAAPTVNMTAAPANGDALHVERTLPITQEVDLLTQGPFSPETHTEMHDQRVMVDQQLARRIARLEALASLTSIANFAAQLVTMAFAADAVEVRDTFPLTTAVVGEVTGVLVAKVVDLNEDEDGNEAIMVRNWSWAANLLTIDDITGLQPGHNYLLTLLCLSL